MRIPYFAFLLVFGLFGIIVLARPLGAQEDQSDQAAQIVQLFGEGNGVNGIVTASSASDFIIRTAEGESYKVFYGPNTRLMKERQPIGASDVHPGDELIALGQLDNKAKTLGAVFIFDADAAQVSKARAGFGKSWTAGKVTAIHDLRITIDPVMGSAGSKQTQVIAVDENTSFRERGQSVTLGDIKVGDFINAQGALHNKIFVASVLRVMGPAAGNAVLGDPAALSDSRDR